MTRTAIVTGASGGIGQGRRRTFGQGRLCSCRALCWKPCEGRGNSQAHRGRRRYGNCGWRRYLEGGRGRAAFREGEVRVWGNHCWGPRIIATDRQAPRIYPRMIRLCSRFGSVLFTPKMPAIPSYGNYSRSPVVVNSAGIMLLAPIRKGDIENFDKVIATNLRGRYLVMSEAANHVVDGGRIIVFSSSVLGKSFPSYGAYIASKAGVEGLTRVLANELGPRKITVKCGGAGAGRD